MAENPTTEAQYSKVVFLDTDKLLLDEENPRLASGKGGDTQEDLLKVLWTEMSVDELALSIAANGFFPEENLLVIPSNPQEKNENKKKYIVVEGNRRLAAVRILINDELRNRIKATDIPKITLKQKQELDKLPVAIYKNRKELWEYFGFRHINGPKPWDAFSKAKYVAYVKEKYKISLNEIANKIGDKHATVQKLYRGYIVLQQAESKTNFDKQDIIRNRLFFSHLYTALDQSAYQKFLGITSKNSLKLNPVPKSKYKELHELMIWLYGSKSESKQPLIRTQNPDLNTLREVISNKRALSALRSGQALERAAEIATGDEQRFQEAISRAKEDLIEANGLIGLGYKGDKDLFELISEIKTLVDNLYLQMQSKLSKS